jgi:hypothetical protein
MPPASFILADRALVQDAETTNVFILAASMLLYGAASVEHRRKNNWETRHQGVRLACKVIGRTPVPPLIHDGQVSMPEWLTPLSGPMPISAPTKGCTSIDAVQTFVLH